MTGPHHSDETVRAEHADADVAAEPVSVAEAASVIEAIVDNVERVLVGQREPIEAVLGAVLADGHVLLEDVPGVGKTMLTRSIARSVECQFNRIQFTPDLLPSDITGVNVFDQQTREFEFQPGPVFANVVLGDEINRAPPKTQSALLEAMEERQVTVDGETRTLPSPFTVIATQNTVEPGRTYELPIAELDRFMKRLELGYPDEDEEVELLGRALGQHPIEELEPVTDAATLRAVRATVSSVTVSEEVRRYATRLAEHTRGHAELGVSPRGTIALLEAAQARAVVEGREYVTPDDVKREAPAVLSHRIHRRRGGGESGDGGGELVERALQSVSIP